MTYLIKLRKDAEFDLSEAYKYYEEIRPGLGKDFILCVEQALNKIQQNPRHYKIILKNLRKTPVPRFPYRIYYLIENEMIFVLAVFHIRKDPTNWLKRLRS